MRWRLLLLLPSLGLAGYVAVPGQEPVKISYKDQAAPVLQKYCMQCHGGAKPRAGFDVSKLNDQTDRKTWEKVIRALHAREMPPEDKPQPSAAERDKLLAFLDQKLAVVDCTKGVRDPGRVTLRRLNRVEYNNTIRDLLNVTFNPADDFPSDDVGYGFDNIGDVLSMSPLLMEKYLAAAERIMIPVVELALAQRDPKPPLRRYVSGDLRATIDAPRIQPGNARQLGSNGALFVMHDFPADGEYLFRIRAYGDQGGPDPVRMVLRLDGVDAKTFDVRAVVRRSEEYTFKMKVQAGKRRVAAAFTNDFYDEKEKIDRNLYVQFIEVEAPPTLGVNKDYTRLFVALPTDKVTKDEAARKILGAFLRRAFRRPTTPAEVDRYLKLFTLADKQGEPFEKAIGLALQGALCSPHFLFKIEKDPEKPQTIRTLDEHELAVRLSYFLWSTMPDEELMTLADKGELRKNLTAQVRRMMKDERIKALTENFAGQWLQTRNLKTLAPDRNLFPNYSDNLRDDMIKEVELFFNEVVEKDLSLVTFLDADFTHVNERLAKHYGIRDVIGSQFRRVTLKDTPRGGVLTMAAILTTTSNPTRTSPVKRGKWILENVLNAPPPPPPPGAGELSEDKAIVESAPLRQRMEMHRAKPDCAICHNRMDALGFAFENFDAVGAWREKDGKFPIDPAGELPGGEKIKSATDLKQVLRKRGDAFARCLAEKMLTYALGRGVEYTDKCVVDDVVAALKKDEMKFSRLVLAIVESDAFQKRRAVTSR